MGRRGISVGSYSGDTWTTFPVEGYVGTTKPRSGREIPLPEWLAAIVSNGEMMHFSYHPEMYYPVFSPLKETLRSSSTDAKGTVWASVGQNPVRTDGDTPVVQLPARFFEDYTGPQSRIPLGPVEPQAQIDPGHRLQFILGWPSFIGSFQCFLLTTEELASIEEQLFSRLFSSIEQRSRLIYNLDGTELEHEMKLLTRVVEFVSSL